MSDILEDQKIHYIVKDYRRMYDMHSQMVDAIKEATAAIKHKDNRIRDLEKQVSNLQDKLKKAITDEKSSATYDAVIKTRDQLASIEARAKHGLDMLNGVIEVLKGVSVVEEDPRFDDLNIEDYENVQTM